VDTERMIREMNLHIPVARRTLLEHIDSGDLTYRTRNGHVCSFDADEIGFLNEFCTEMEKMRLRLPIFVTTDTSSDGTWKVDGLTEAAVVSRILDKKPLKDDLLRVYHPDLKRLRNRLPNAVVVLFLP